MMLGTRHLKWLNQEAPAKYITALLCCARHNNSWPPWFHRS
jgi:hypothetical protein